MGDLGQIVPLVSYDEHSVVKPTCDSHAKTFVWTCSGLMFVMRNQLLNVYVIVTSFTT